MIYRYLSLILPALLFAFTLSGCAQFPTSLPAPASAADQTVLDEKALLALELSYKASRLTAEEALEARLVSPALARKLRAANRNANAVLIRARAAYDAANAQSYAAALDEAELLVTDFFKLVQSKEISRGL